MTAPGHDNFTEISQFCHRTSRRADAAIVHPWLQGPAACRM